MIYRLAADVVLLFHLAFILFAALGAVLAVRWRWLSIIHLPVATWGIFVELTRRICPLTYLENHLRLKAGQAGYSDSFIEHYLLSIIYPSGLTPHVQFILAGALLIVNTAIYGYLLFGGRQASEK